MIRTIVDRVMEGAIKRFFASGRADETFADREYFQHYGFTSRPLAGAEGILVRDGNHIIMIASDDRRYRLAVEDGEVALYTDEGDKVHLKRGRQIEVVGGEKVTVTTKEAHVDASVKAVVDTATAEVNASAKATVTSPEVDVVASAKVVLTTPLVEASQDVHVMGKLTVDGAAEVTGAVSSHASVSDPTGTMQTMRGQYNTHVHTAQGAQNPTTGPSTGMN